MMGLIYDVMNKNGKQVGFVILEDDYELRICTDTSSVLCNSILDVFDYIGKHSWYLNDMQGDLYSLDTHNEIVEKITTLGIGYMIR